MEIWLDTPDLNVVMRAAKKGIVKGVTTNPSILAKVKHISETIRQLLKLQDGPVTIQVTSVEADEMIEEGRRIAEFSDRMVVKIPVCKEGLIAMRTLEKEGVSILATGIFHESQLLLAANLGVTFVTPYFSRIAKERDAFQAIRNMLAILDKGGYESKLLVASVKEINHLIFLAEVGTFAATIKEDLFAKLIATDPLQEELSEQFRSDWKRAHGDISIKDILTS